MQCQIDVPGLGLDKFNRLDEFAPYPSWAESDEHWQRAAMDPLYQPVAEPRTVMGEFEFDLATWCTQTSCNMHSQVLLGTFNFASQTMCYAKTCVLQIMCRERTE